MLPIFIQPSILTSRILWIFLILWIGLPVILMGPCCPSTLIISLLNDTYLISVDYLHVDFLVYFQILFYDTEVILPLNQDDNFWTTYFTKQL